ncbi:MAG: hypothetical protein ABIV51_06315 [Saprospiraceae bacterium]
MKIVGGKLEKALDLYSEAFQYRKVPYIKDVHNALICALKLGQQYQIDYYSCMIAKYKVDLEPYKQYPNFTVSVNCIASRKSSPWDGNFLDSMLRVAIAIRERPKTGDCCREAFVVDSLNFDALLDAIDLYGFPNDMDLDWNSAVDVPPYYLTILYALGSSIKEDSVMKYLDFLFAEDLISPSIYSEYHDYRAGFTAVKSSPSLGSDYVRYWDGNYYILYFPVSRDRAMNDRRKVLGLERIEQFRKKILFQEKNPQYCFVQKGYLEDIYWHDARMARSMIRSWNTSNNKMGHKTNYNP